MTARYDKVPPEEGAVREPEPFLARWSRRKEEARREEQQPVPQRTVDPETPAPELPPLEKLTFESDYRGFLHPKVSEDMRRAALKKLFSDPHFNVMDGLDIYIDDYSKSEPIPAAMLAGLRQAQKILEWAKEDAEQRNQAERQQASTPREALEPPAAEDSTIHETVTQDLAEPIPAASHDGDTSTKT